MLWTAKDFAVVAVDKQKVTTNSNSTTARCNEAIGNSWNSKPKEEMKHRKVERFVLVAETMDTFEKN